MFLSMGVARFWSSEKATVNQTKSSFDFPIAPSSTVIFGTKSPPTSMRDFWSLHLAKATLCPSSSRKLSHPSVAVHAVNRDAVEYSGKLEEKFRQESLYANRPKTRRWLL